MVVLIIIISLTILVQHLLQSARNKVAAASVVLFMALKKETTTNVLVKVVSSLSFYMFLIEMCKLNSTQFLALFRISLRQIYSVFDWKWRLLFVKK